MKAAIYIASQQRGLLIALGDLLARKFGIEVTFIVIGYAQRNLVWSLLGDKDVKIIVLSDIKEEKIENVIEEAKLIEKKFGILLSLILSEDRALGQGYLFNVEKVPDIKRASWSHERKLNEIVTNIKNRETLLNGFDFVVSHKTMKEWSVCSNPPNTRFFSLNSVKWGDRLIWSDNEYMTNERFIKRVKEYLEISDANNNGLPEYEIETGHTVNRNFKFSYFHSFKGALRIMRSDIGKIVLNTRKKNSYHFFGWVPSFFRKVRNYKYVKSISHRPSELVNYRIVFFTLHLEPEIALLTLSPEFNNSMEVIAWISKSLPADTILVVKEHYHSFAVRSKWYYRQINKIGNVVWADPDIHSWEWINQAEVVATITGTVGTEAVHAEKLVLSFGMHQIINFLPSVRYVSNYTETRKALNEFLNGTVSKDLFKKVKMSFSKAQIDSSFDLPDYKLAYGSSKLEIEMAEKALQNLFSEFPELFSALKPSSLGFNS
jgi:hypothetical protein